MPTHVSHLWSVTGFKQHGKDTFSKCLASSDKRYEVMHFADRLKEVIMNVIGLSWEHTHGAAKEVPFETPLEIDAFVPALQDALQLDVLPRGMTAVDARQVMQFIGTEYVRSVRDTYWTDYLRDKIIAKGSHAIVSDTRFPNEVAILRDLGARSLRVVLIGATGNSNHASERDIPNLDVDAEFHFKWGQMSTIAAVAAGLATLPTLDA